MSIPRALLTITLIGILPGASRAQALPPPGVIIPCEGPDMPAACPRDTNAPGSIDAARADLAARQAALMDQQQSLTIRRRELVDQLYRNQQQALPPPPQANPYLATPDLRAAARVVDGIVTGTAP
jgi:hypothetical protein